MSSAIVHQASRMNIKSTHERITLFKLALDVNDHERDEILNELMHTYIMETLESDSTRVIRLLMQLI